MSYEPPIHDPRHDEDFLREQAAKSIDWLAAIRIAHDAIILLDACTDGYYRADESKEYIEWEKLEKKLTKMGILNQ